MTADETQKCVMNLFNKSHIQYGEDNNYHHCWWYQAFTSGKPQAEGGKGSNLLNLDSNQDVWLQGQFCWPLYCVLSRREDYIKFPNKDLIYVSIDKQTGLRFVMIILRRPRDKKTLCFTMCPTQYLNATMHKSVRNITECKA